MTVAIIRTTTHTHTHNHNVMQYIEHILHALGNWQPGPAFQSGAHSVAFLNWLHVTRNNYPDQAKAGELLSSHLGEIHTTQSAHDIR